MTKWSCVVALALGVLAAGCGVSRARHQKVLDALGTCQGELGEVNQVRHAQRAEIEKLQAELGTVRADRDKKTAAQLEKERKIAALLKEMEDNKQEVVTELEHLRNQRDQAEKRLAAYRDLTKRFQALVDTGQLQVAFRHGQMLLKLPSEILFASGRSRLSRKGRQALREVLDVLIDYKDRRFQIAGHTDNAPIRGGRYRDNWHLSTARARSVVEFMIDAGFDPKNLSATGYGEHDPVAANDTEEGRSLNRRIEIILVPDLSELPTLTVESAPS